MSPAPNPQQRACREPLYDINPLGISIEVFYSDRTLETFGRCGAGWFWWPRRRGFAPKGPANGPFPTSYSAYLSAFCEAICMDQSAPAPAPAGVTTVQKMTIIRTVIPQERRKTWPSPTSG